MDESIKKDWENQEEIVEKEIVEKEIEMEEEVKEKPKHIPVKPPIPKFWAIFQRWNQFRWWKWNNFGGNARTWRWASRGR